MDVLPFLLVEEAIKKNKASVKLQEYVALMVWERARVEQTYIKNLNGWADKIVKEGKDFRDNEVFQMIADILPGEAELTAAAHQRVYNQILEDSGPYNILYRDMGLTEGIFHRNCRGVAGIEEDFVKDNRNRVNLESVHSHRKKAMQDCKVKLDLLESQMTSRSRLATRRSSKGRRVDSLMNKMIDQKRKHDLEEEGSEVAERELESLCQGKKMTLLEMLKDLNVLEKDRVRLMFAQLIEFMTRLRHIEMPEESATRRRAMDDMLKALSNVDALSVADAAWQKMERAAKARKVGTVFSLQDLITPSAIPGNVRPSMAPSLVRTSPSGTPGIVLPPAGGTPIPPSDARERKSRPFGGRIRPRDRDTRRNPPRSNKSPVTFTSVHVFEPPTSSSSEESVTRVMELAKRHQHRQEEEPERVILFTRPDISDTSVRSDDIETIYLPEEDIPAYRPPAPFPPRPFCPSLSDDDEDRDDDFVDEPIIEAHAATRFGFDASNVRLYAKPLDSEPEEEEEEKEGDSDNIALMRGVRVIALHPYSARTTDQLSFKQNQVIKQKFGANDEGFAYGWTKETKLSQKQHGYYPQALVKLMVPQPGRSNKRSEKGS
ncbi:uncharacterized protein LOC110450262 isoform X2 [Mizuhopecten yessoensis]|uniref:uncharacterized protein LOC110450262 isoform X2 n=1 Tax=Mizuhopecten yessoensis TaxID=6573 RepID=UPI000B458C5E|nr:uncharacterized protein LOC110450262 isoform X2 [Mizuhopecten yessoensis]